MEESALLELLLLLPLVAGLAFYVALEIKYPDRIPESRKHEQD